MRMSRPTHATDTGTGTAAGPYPEPVREDHPAGGAPDQPTDGMVLDPARAKATGRQPAAGQPV
jgi:hypothetical protein